MSNVNPKISVATARQMLLSKPLPDPARQAAAEEAFFSSLRLKNGTYKYTYPRRLDHLNQVVNSLLPLSRPLKLMDVAVSSGISTLEWMRSLDRTGIEYNMVASDLTLYGLLISIGKRLHVLTDSRGYPLQFEVAGRAIPNPPGGRNTIRYFLPLVTIKIALALGIRVLQEACSTIDEGQSVRRRGINCQRVLLVSRGLRESSHLRLIEEDLLANNQSVRDLHALRAANILNKSYFDNDTLLRILVNLRCRLANSGLLVVCRTDDSGTNNGTVFRLNEARTLEVLERIGEGSEIEELALSLPG
jgi:hypothetical protein